ncbi:hypothetical protein [Bacillus thuringiensis]|uniref:Uncharacterized protein n=1 Tax=Bacillus thuringiensis subsp. jegathesan TaxID=56955 RepID=A0A9X6QY90_BACTJ|nr:hypothetical protein [Bacillus thuringiensis]OUB64837.1 hypothetical protein BK750_17450 [Bacillus thuringiensis serovar jegathesan]OUB64838.1 hypothetical protein BK750_17435 [Bacillus thuringiensis serovar jegathesan]
MENRYQNNSPDYSNKNDYNFEYESNSNTSSYLNAHTIDPSEKNHVLPFSVFINLPKGFHIQNQIVPKLVYNLSYLSMSKEICKKSIEVDNCGYVDVDLHVLKIKGCLSFLLNVGIEPIHKQKMCSNNHKDDFIFLCAQDTLYVDHILKYSIDNLPYYVIDEDHIQVRKLEIEMLELSHEIAKISGEFYFEYE